MRKPTLSPSKITTYLACPVKYRWTYLDHRGKWFLRAKSYYSFGLSLHAVLQRFHDSKDAGVQTTDEALASLEENWVSAGFDSPEEAAEALAEGRELLTAYLQSPAAVTVGATTLYVEKQLRTDFQNFTLVGRLDRVDEFADGTLEIVDYKSSRHASVEELKNDVAMNCYRLLLRSLMPDKRILSTIVTLQTNERVSVEITEEESEVFRTDLEFIGNEIVNREFHEIRPVAKHICRNCDFLLLCERDEEFAQDMRALFGYPAT